MAVAGNVGVALSRLVGEIDEGVTIVCEASSFQLEDTPRLRVSARRRGGRAHAEDRRVQRELPKPYKIETGGLFEESAASQASVFAVVPLMIVLMLTIMMILLVSFRRVAMVFCGLPLGLMGRRRRVARVQPSARFRRDPRHPRADRYDREKRG